MNGRTDARNGSTGTGDNADPGDQSASTGDSVTSARMRALPAVAIVGRPNVGKSTLLNRFLGRRTAIVEEHPGVTRDRAEHAIDWTGRTFRVIDTGGWQARPEDAMGTAIREQAEHAIATADVVLMVCDSTVGVTTEDAEAAKLLLRSGVPVILAVNKIDGPSSEAGLGEFYALGLGDPYPVSALHGRRSGDLLDAIVGRLPEATEGPAEPALEVPAVAIVGRPNVGKSTLFNKLAGEERAIVHDEPGTTRDTIDTIVQIGETAYRFVDTAGLRRRAKVADRTEYYSRVRAIRALERATAALLVVDATAGITFADQKVAEEVVEAGCALVVVLNKWDLLKGDDRVAAAREVEAELGFLDWAPKLRVSARTGAGVHRLAGTLATVLEHHGRRIPTHRLVKALQTAQQHHPPPAGSGRPARIRYGTQVRTSPPTFALFANKRIPVEYLRYLDHVLRAEFGFEGTPLRIKVRLDAHRRRR